MELLERLSNAFGVSGNEKDVRELIEEEIKEYVDNVSVDKMGNLIAHKKGKSPKVMLTAHMDEVGIMVKSIDDLGRIFVSALGSVDAIALVGHRVHIETKKGIIHGIVTTKELSDGKYVTNLPKVEDVIVDTGLSKKELVSRGVEIGTYLPLETEFFYLGSEDVISGKAFDDRIGCYVLIELAKRLKNVKHDIYYVFTVQEELGLYGAITSTYMVEPDWALVIDVSETSETSDPPTRILGQGPCITVKDAEMIGNIEIDRWLEDTAKKNKIPFQLDVSDAGTTDAVSISVTKGGVPSTVIGIPVRNIHTVKYVAHKRDIANAIKLIEELLKRPPKFER